MIVSSNARTNKLWCSECKEKIKKGDFVYFDIDEITEKMIDCFCEKCGDYMELMYVEIEDNIHPFSPEAHGQL